MTAIAAMMMRSVVKEIVAILTIVKNVMAKAVAKTPAASVQ